MVGELTGDDELRQPMRWAGFGKQFNRHPAAKTPCTMEAPVKRHLAWATIGAMATCHQHSISRLEESSGRLPYVR